MVNEDLITGKELAQQLLKYADRDDVNPLDSTQTLCLYTTPDRTKHCIIGQAIVDLGREPISPLVVDGANVLDGIWTDLNTALFARRIQETADNVNEMGNRPPNPRPWKEVIYIHRDELEHVANAPEVPSE